MAFSSYTRPQRAAAHLSPPEAMNRYLLRIEMDIVIDSDAHPGEVSNNLYARLSELVQSEDHMIDADIQCFDMPGNKHEAEVEA